MVSPLTIQPSRRGEPRGWLQPLGVQMRKLWKVALYSLAGIGGFYLFMFIGFNTGLIGADCQSYRIKELASPTGQFIAYQEQQKCKDDVLKVYIWLGKNGANKRWSVFSAPLPFRRDVAGPTPVLDIDLAWLSDTNLMVTYPEGIKANMYTGVTEGVLVDFVEKHP